MLKDLTLKRLRSKPQAPKIQKLPDTLALPGLLYLLAPVLRESMAAREKEIHSETGRVAAKR